jgi:hypothetical protein
MAATPSGTTRPDEEARLRGGHVGRRHLYGPVQFRSRKANRDFEVGGVRIRKDQFVVPLLAAAGRDPGKYRCPNDVDFGRAAFRDHLSFDFGPRACVGAAFARAELRESVTAVLERLPGLRLAPPLPHPSTAGSRCAPGHPCTSCSTPDPPTATSSASLATAWAGCYSATWMVPLAASLCRRSSSSPRS